MASHFVSPTPSGPETLKISLRAFVPIRYKRVKKSRGPDGQRILTIAKRKSARISLIQTLNLDASEKIFVPTIQLPEPELQVEPQSERRSSETQGTQACRLSRYDGLYPYPSTPITPKQTLLPPPLTLNLQPKTPKQTFFQPGAPHILELPGSLLLPSQGFPQSDPPCAPSRPNQFYISSSTESSPTASTPELSASPETDFSEHEMPKHFPPMHLARATKPVKSTSTSTASSPEGPTIRKPLFGMSAEELLRCLPECDSETVQKAWIPAMIKEHEKIKSLLQAASEIKLERHNELRNHGEDLKSISEDARKISNTYKKAIESVESLVERDMKSCLERLEATENTLETALVTIETTQRTVEEKEDAIVELRGSHDHVVQVLGAYINEHMSDSFYNADYGEYQVIMQIISDHEYSHPHESAGRFLRISEDTHTANVAALREAQLKAEKYRELAVTQNEVIGRNSANLDSRMEEYEQCMKTINERNQEVLLLMEKTERLKETVKDFESGFKVSRTTKAVQDQLFKENEEMQDGLKSMEIEHAKQLEDRDIEIRNLRQMLGSAKEEVLARKTDVKNVITHTQALLSPLEPSEDMHLSGLTPKERRMLAKEDKKRLKKGLPVSKSMLTLATHPEVSRLKRKEVSRFSDSSNSSMDSPILRTLSKDEKSQWVCSMPQKRSSPELRNASDISPEYPARPRMDLPGFGSGRQFHTTGDRHVATAVVSQLLGKELPIPSEPRYAIDIYGGDSPPDDRTSSNAEHSGVPKNDSVDAATLRKRALSEIPEASVEDTESNRTFSPSSSAQEDFKNGVHRIFDYLREGSQESSATTPSLTGGFISSQGDYSESEVFESGVAKAVVVGKSPILRGGAGGNDDKRIGVQDVSPLSKVAGLRIGGDPWLSGSPRRETKS